MNTTGQVMLNWPKGFNTVWLDVAIDPIGDFPDMVFQTFDFHQWMTELSADDEAWKQYPQSVIKVNGLKHLEEELMRVNEEQPEGWEETHKSLLRKQLEFRDTMDCEYVLLLQVQLSELIALLVFQESFKTRMLKEGLASFPVGIVWPYVTRYKVSPTSRKIMDMIDKVREEAVKQMEESPEE